MRRTAVAIAGLGLTTMAGLGLTAALLVPAAARTAGPPVPSGPYAAAAASPDEAESPGTPATLLANVAPATVPASTELATPKPSVLPYSASPGGPIVGQLRPKVGGAGRPAGGSASPGWMGGAAFGHPTQRVDRLGSPERPDDHHHTQPDRDIDQPAPSDLLPGWTTRVLSAGWRGQIADRNPNRPVVRRCRGRGSQREQYIYGPVVLLTASHSNVFTEFDGGDGTVGIHGYPSNPASTMGVASSHGCVRASPQTMAIIANVSVGTPVDIVA